MGYNDVAPRWVRAAIYAMPPRDAAITNPRWFARGKTVPTYELKRDFVVEIAALRRIPRRRAARARSGSGSGGPRCRGRALAIATATARAVAALFATRAVQQGQLAAEVLQHDFRGVFLLPGLVGVFSRLERTFQIDLAALAEE